MKSEKRISKDEYYLNIAESIGKRSTCLRRKFGAVLVSSKNVMVGSGYNGSARGVVNCDKMGVCLKDIKSAEQYSNYDWCLAVHAEENTIINSNRDDRIGATLYIVGVHGQTGEYTFSWPCKRCKRILINALVETVVTRNDKGGIEKYAVAKWAKEDTAWRIQNSTD